VPPCEGKVAGGGFQSSSFLLRRLLLVLDVHVPEREPHVLDESSSNHLCTAATYFEAFVVGGSK
jgi:hypothetical protein